MRLAIPKPCGIMSTQRWNVEVASFQKITRALARTAIPAESKVSVYNFPVLRMILEHIRKVLLRKDVTYHPAKTLPVEIAI